jgi:hypothetical protein
MNNVEIIEKAYVVIPDGWNSPVSFYLEVALLLLFYCYYS